MPEPVLTIAARRADWLIALATCLGALVALLALRAGDTPLAARALFLTIACGGVALYASLRRGHIPS